MTTKLECRELNIENCDFVASGETAGDVVEEIVKHLRTKHHIDMPDADTIMLDEIPEGSAQMADPAAVLIVERLRESLGIVPSEGTGAPDVSIGRTPTA